MDETAEIQRIPREFPGYRNSLSRNTTG